MKKKIELVALLIVLCTALTAFFVVNSAAATQDVYTYTVTDGKATITDVATTASGDITVPATLGGYPVTAIGTYAFEGCTSLTGVTLPSGLVSIGNNAFKNCISLETIHFYGNINDYTTCNVGSGNDNFLNAKVVFHPIPN